MSVAVRQLSTRAADFEAEFQRVRHWSAQTDALIEQRVADIVADVRVRGDVAVLELTRDRKSTRLNSSHLARSRMPSSA